MRPTTTLALAGLFSAAVFAAGCQTDHDTDTHTTRTTTTTRSSGTSGYGADDKDASAKDSSAKDSSSKDSTAKNASDKDATTAAQSDQGRGQGRGGRGAHATIEPSKAPGQDDVKGMVRFTPADKGVRVRAEITGLEPNSKHGFHIHEKADLSDPELKSAGGHFNPGMHKHGGPGAGEHHAGDLGNLEADDKGKATYDQTIEGITLDDSKTGIIGKSVIIHGKADDLKTDPAGDSGARIAGGVIEAGGGRGQGQGGRGQQRGERPRSQQGQ